MEVYYLYHTERPRDVCLSVLAASGGVRPVRAPSVAPGLRLAACRDPRGAWCTAISVRAGGFLLVNIYSVLHV